MTGLNAARAAGQINATTLGTGTVQGASPLTSGNSSTVTLRRESCLPLAIGHNKPLIKKTKVPGFTTRLNTAVLAQTDDNFTMEIDGDDVNTTFSSEFTLFGFNDAVLTNPTGSSSGKSYGYPRTGTITYSPAAGIHQVLGDPATGVIDLIFPFLTYSITWFSLFYGVYNSGHLTIGHWEVNRNGSVNYNEYTSDSAAPARLQGIYNFMNPAGLEYNQWIIGPDNFSQPFITTRRTTLVVPELAVYTHGVKFDGKKGIMVNKNEIPTTHYSSTNSNLIPVVNRTRAHMNRSKDNIIRGSLPIALDDPAILYNNYRVICTSSQGREL